MLEAEVERYLTAKVKQLGGKAYKWESPGNSGVPDRIVMLPGGELFFVELKRPGEKPRKLQLKRAKELRELGQKVVALDSLEAVDNFLARR